MYLFNKVIYIRKSKLNMELKYNNIFKIIFKKLPKDLKKEAFLSDLNFNSLSQITLISELEENYGIIVDPLELGNLNTISDLTLFLDKNLSK